MHGCDMLGAAQKMRSSNPHWAEQRRHLALSTVRAEGHSRLKGDEEMFRIIVMLVVGLIAGATDLTW